MLIFKPLVIHGLSLTRCLESCTSGNNWNIWCTVVTNVWHQSSSLSTYLSFQFSVVIFFNKLWTISGTKYPSHRSNSCTVTTGILERYKTWQVVAYITVEHATQCTYYFFLVRLFHKNMINAEKLGDTSRQRYIRQIPVWHHSEHVWYYIFIGFIRSIFMSPVKMTFFLSSSLVNMVSNVDTKWVTFPLGCRYIPPTVNDNPLYINSIKRLSNSHFEQLHDFVNITSSLRTTFNSESCV